MRHGALLWGKRSLVMFTRSYFGSIVNTLLFQDHDPEMAAARSQPRASLSAEPRPPSQPKAQN